MSSDPLVLLILAAAGLLPSQGCGGQSIVEAEGARDGVDTGDSGGVGGSGPGTGGVSVSGVGGGIGGSGISAPGGSAGVGGEATGGVSGTGGVPPIGGTGAAPLVTEGPLACTGPTFPFGEEAGFVMCAQGFLHRRTKGSCPQTPIGEGEPSGNTPPLCRTDADCAYLENGRCDGWPARSCVSSCETDADCEAGYICSCGSVANLCVPSNCETDADCGEGLLCASYVVRKCQTSIAFACQLADDKCTISCPAGYICDTDSTSNPIRRDCIPEPGGAGVCGRPFLVSGAERLAQVTMRGDWCDEGQRSPVLATLTATERLALALHWQAVAAMEHASIAAFARFALELLALGAPAQLLELTSAAMADEQRHATTCFALASAFAGTQIGPGPLRIEGCLAAVDLESVALTAFLEGCIGETVAAVEARELSLLAEDPVIRGTLAGIAQDEGRHAVLAWTFLAWTLNRGGEELSERIHEAWRGETRRGSSPPRGMGLRPERELELGMPSATFRANVRHHVLENIVKPCLDALTTGAVPGGAETLPERARDLERVA